MSKKKKANEPLINEMFTRAEIRRWLNARIAYYSVMATTENKADKAHAINTVWAAKLALGILRDLPKRKAR